MFLRGVLGFTVVGQTNFNIDSGSITKGSGVSNASINQGLGNEFAVAIPTGSYSVGVSDVNRILALKSTTNPKLNSGLFRVTGINTTSNWLYILNRSLDQLPAESGLTWRLFEKEQTVVPTFVNDTNATPGVYDRTYHGNGASTTSRIILQSPHSTAWQVRICVEWNEDVGTTVSFGKMGAPCSFAPGVNGDASGDFAVGGQHLHIPMWFNVVDQGSAASLNTNGSCPGMDAYESNLPTTATTVLAQRYYIWGDDVTGTTCIIARQAGYGGEGIVAFGLPEFEEEPLPTNVIHRLFTFGNTGCEAIRLSANSRTTDGITFAQMGAAFGLNNQPVSCVPSNFCFMSQNAQNSSIADSSLAADSPYIGASELYPWDLIAGTWDFTDTYTRPYLLLEPRRLGSFPMARRGRENFNLFSTSVDASRSYLHVGSGIFLPWSGSILP
jgi:hypothetical protein